jgi:hypothetical protein
MRETGRKKYNWPGAKFSTFTAWYVELSADSGVENRYPKLGPSSCVVNVHVAQREYDFIRHEVRHLCHDV